MGLIFPPSELVFTLRSKLPPPQPLLVRECGERERELYYELSITRGLGRGCASELSTKLVASLLRSMTAFHVAELPDDRPEYEGGLTGGALRRAA